MNTVIVRVKLFPKIDNGNDLQCFCCGLQKEVVKNHLFTTHISQWSCGLGLFRCHLRHRGGTLLVNQMLFKMASNQFCKKCAEQTLGISPSACKQTQCSICTRNLYCFFF